jgi:uncharacterized protein (TIGR03437 family)
LSRCKLTLVYIPHLLTAALASAQVNVATANYGNSRLNGNVSETTLTHTAVSGGAFGKVGSFPVDGQVYSQPLYVSGVQIPGQGIKNVVFVATMNDSVYAIDADAPGSAAPLWRVSLGTAAQSAAIPYVNDMNPHLGILSTPVIDVNAQVIYAVAETFESGAPVFRLHGLSLQTGQEMQNGPVAIAGSVAGTAGDAVNGRVEFDPFWHLQRPGLALANGTIYIAFASHGDAGPYHGWVMAYNSTNLQQQTAIFNSTPNGNGGGIWQSGRGLAVDEAGNVFVATGNGDFDGVSNFSGAILKLSGSDLSVLDWYTPAAWAYLNANDLDVGSTGPILPSGIDLALTGDKGGRLISLALNSLGHVESAPGVDGFPVTPAGIFNLALWQTDRGALLYERDLDGFLKSYAVTSTGIVQTPVSTGVWSGDSLYQGMAVSSNGSSDGIVWETTGDHSQPGIPATLHAWNASDLTQELWNSDLSPADVLGCFAKFAPPLVANGRVYVPTFSNQLAIYGLETSAVNTAAPQISAVLNGASLVPTPVAPGGIVSILGKNLGPAAGAAFQLDDSGKVPDALGGIQVFFDGVAAPLLYSSANRITLEAPFELAGPSTQIIVSSEAGESAPVWATVASAAPALLTASQLGNGQLAALNEDGSVNSATNPAAVNSVVSIFGTGWGKTTPAGMDGSVSGEVLPVPVLPVSVQLGGLQAYLLYAGAAPATVEGVFQVNFRIPPLAPTGTYIMVVLQVGSALSQTDVWISVGD